MRILKYRCIVLGASLFLPLVVSPQENKSSKPEAQAKNSDQDVVIENLTVDLAFNEDGTYRQETVTRMRVQSDAAVQQLGVLTFSYENDIDRVEAIDVRVHKADGSVVVTPEANFQDVTAEVARSAPTYSNEREKQVPVKSLSAGDTLETRLVVVRTRAEAPGQFWYAYNFTKDQVVLDETLRISVPAQKYVKVSSPSLAPGKREENGRVLYTWKSSCAVPPKPDEEEEGPPRRPRPAVQLTTFRTWEEVGQWYRALEQSRVEVTPAIRSKAAELTAGLHSDLEKQRALYQFVATKFRYISISLGAARYQPHSADDVLANQYGDCKDKHTLFASLLAASGIEAWAALIGHGLEFDPDVPSPAQFNHVITYLPNGGAIQWLDTTPEVAPYGLLHQLLREQTALLVPSNGAARTATIPEKSPFAAEETITVRSKLSADGTLTAHFELTTRGDSEVLLRSIFHATAPAQWQAVAQKLAALMGYGGTVREVDVDNPTNLDAPFHYSCSYERKDFSDWSNRRISAPVPPIALHSIEDKDKPKEPVYFGMPGRMTYRSTIDLPVGYSVEIPDNVKLQSDIADYTATYAVDHDNVLTVERVFTVKQSKLSSANWEGYTKFAKAMDADQSQLMQLVHSETGAASRVVRDVPEAAELVARAGQALQSHDFNAAREALDRAEKINPEQANLWMVRTLLYQMQGDNQEALAALQKELEYHPGNESTYRMRAWLEQQMGRKDAAQATLRQWLKMAPDNADAANMLATSLIDSKKYGEAADALREPIKANPKDVSLSVKMVDALIRGGQKTEGLALIAQLRGQPLDNASLNNLAWSLADSKTEPALARDLGLKAVTQCEEQMRKLTLADLSREDLQLVESLGADWDTLGWAYFQAGDLAQAEKYLKSAWVLVENPAGADHLGQLYERQNRKADAIRAYQLALAVNSDLPETKDRLSKLGGKADDGRPTLRRGTPDLHAVSAEEELSNIRTTLLPDLKLKGTAELFVLLSPSGVEEVRFLSGDDALKAAAEALRKARLNLPFPDQGVEKVPRRGILSCSALTVPACRMVLLLPANTTAEQ